MSTHIYYIVKLCKTPSNNFYDYELPVPHASPQVSKCFALKSFRTAAATVTYCHFVDYIIASRQMANIQMKGILYKKTACLEPVHDNNNSAVQYIIIIPRLGNINSYGDHRNGVYIYIYP